MPRVAYHSVLIRIQGGLKLLCQRLSAVLGTHGDGIAVFVVIVDLEFRQPMSQHNEAQASSRVEDASGGTRDTQTQRITAHG